MRKYAKIILFLCDVCCILAGVVSGTLMLVQRAELKAIEAENKTAAETQGAFQAELYIAQEIQ